MNRKKLEKLGINLPLLPTTSVGSFPKPPELKKARSQFAKGNITAEELEKFEEQATVFWIRTQQELGMDVLVDGEMYRGDMVAYFAEKMSGFELGDLVRSYGNRYYHKPIITGEVGWDGPMTVDWWKFASGLTSRPMKGMLTGPYTIMDWSFNEYYPDRRTACMAIAGQIRKEVEALLDAGARIIQIDEPATSVRPEEVSLVAEAMHAVIDGLPGYFLTHICYGAFRKIYPGMLDIPVDNFDLEMSNSQLNLLELFHDHPFSKDISFGLVDVHSHKLDEVSAVKARLKQALEVLEPEQIWVDPDCGLKTRTVEEAIEKMRVVAEATLSIREVLVQADRTA
jgi:5-methyltetrahydropteroyltriglutamate--homocysteine methyltransferase